MATGLPCHPTLTLQQSSLVIGIMAVRRTAPQHLDESCMLQGQSAKMTAHLCWGVQVQVCKRERARVSHQHPEPAVVLPGSRLQFRQVTFNIVSVIRLMLQTTCALGDM